MQYVKDRAAEKSTDDAVWYIDFGASNHMTPHGDWFTDMVTENATANHVLFSWYKNQCLFRLKL